MSNQPPVDFADADDLSLASKLVRHAAVLANGMRDRGLARRHKTSVTDIVTEADQAAEEFITAALRRYRPEDGIIGEEGSQHPSSSGRTWVIDPVDGTFNFASGTLYWCSALSLRPEPSDGSVLLGAIYHPAAGELWVADSAGAPTLNGNPLKPLADGALAQSCVASYLHPTRLTDPCQREPFLAMIGAAATVRMFGSGSCELAAVAAGRVDAWVQVAVPEWDWLPGMALVQAAGGSTCVIEHRGHAWHLAGRPTAVAELAERLTTANGVS